MEIAVALDRIVTETLIAMRFRLAKSLAPSKEPGGALSGTACFAICGKTALSLYLGIPSGCLEVYLQNEITLNSRSGLPECSSLFKKKFKEIILIFIKSQLKEIQDAEIETGKSTFMIRVVTASTNHSIQVKFNYWPPNQTIHELLRPNCTSLGRTVLILENLQLLVSENDQFKTLPEFTKEKRSFLLDLVKPQPKSGHPRELLEALEFANRINFQLNRKVVEESLEFCDLLGQACRDSLNRADSGEMLKKGLRGLAESETWKNNFRDLVQSEALRAVLPDSIGSKYPTYKQIPFKKSACKMLLERAIERLQSKEFADLLSEEQDNKFEDAATWRLLALVVATVGGALEFRESEPHFKHLLQAMLGESLSKEVIAVIYEEKDNSIIEFIFKEVLNLDLEQLFVYCKSGKEFHYSELSEEDSLILDVNPADDSCICHMNGDLDTSFLTEVMAFTSVNSDKGCNSSILPNCLTGTASSLSTSVSPLI